MDLSAEWRDKIKSAQVTTTEAYQDAMHVAAALSESLASDAALVADNVATSIQKAARNVKLGWIVVLTLPVLLLIATLWVVKRHVMVPITSAIAGLESIGRPDSGPLILPTPVFKELATIVNAVGAYDAISQDLKRTNEMLQVVSNRDALRAATSPPASPRSPLPTIPTERFQHKEDHSPEQPVHRKRLNETEKPSEIKRVQNCR